MKMRPVLLALPVWALLGFAVNVVPAPNATGVSNASQPAAMAARAKARSAPQPLVAETFGYDWLNCTDEPASVSNMVAVRLYSKTAEDAIAEVLNRGGRPATYRELAAYRLLVPPLPAGQRLVALGSIAHTGAGVDILQMLVRHGNGNAVALMTKSLPLTGDMRFLIVVDDDTEPERIPMT